MTSTSNLPRPWTRLEAESDTSWIQVLTEAEIASIDAALAHAKSTGKDMLDMGPEDFPLDANGRACLARASEGAVGRWGMRLLRGLPVRRWSTADARLAYWGIGMHLGVARTQNRTSDFMVDVRDDGGSYTGKNARGYNTAAGLDFHIDFCDVVALLCINDAKQGGQSLVVSSLALYEEIERTRPDLVAALHEPYYYHFQGSGGPEYGPWYACPLAGMRDGQLAFRTNRKNILAAQRDFPDVPRLSAGQVEVLALLDRLLTDERFCYSMRLQPGDMQLLNNHAVLHSRTDFVDHDDAAKKRHLMRLWLAVPQAQALPESWEHAYRDSRKGALRGGLRGEQLTSRFCDFESRLARAHGMFNRFGNSGGSALISAAYESIGNAE